MNWFWQARKQQAERELDDELRTTIAMLRDEGLDARTTAIALGGEEQVKEAVRAARSGAWLEALVRDVVYCARRLRRRPGYTLAVVAVLGVGIGLTAALFSTVNALILRPLPFPQPQQLVTIQNIDDTAIAGQYDAHLEPNLHPMFSAFAAYMAKTVNIADGGPPERMPIAAVTEGYFALLGVHPARGRSFLAADYSTPKHVDYLQPPAPTPVVLGNALWRTRYAASPAILGQLLDWGGTTYRVIGIAPAGFAFPPQAQAWIPYRSGLMSVFGTLDNAPLPTLLARLRPGLSLGSAELQFAAWVSHHPDSGAGDPPFLAPLQRQLLGERQGLLLLLWAASGLVLLLACAGAAGLGAGQAWARRRELALRLAIGASAGRIRRQLLTEGFGLGLAGGVVGWLAAGLAGHWLAALWPPVIAGTKAELGAPAVGVTLALALTSGLAVGLAGNQKQWAFDSEHYGRGAGPMRSGKSDWLTAAQLTLAVILLTATAALGRSWIALTAVPVGLNPKRVLAMEVSLPGQSIPLLNYPDAFANAFGAHPERATPAERGRQATAEAALTQIRNFQESAPRQIEALPGVASAGLLTYLPFARPELFVTGLRKPNWKPDSLGDFVLAARLGSSPGALTALGMQFIAGRDFSAADLPGCEAIFSASLMHAMGYPSMPATPVPAFGRGTCRLVGVVADAKLTGLAKTPTPTGYQRMTGSDASPFLIVRAKPGVAPLSLLPAIRHELHQIAPGAAISHITTLEDLLRTSHAQLNQATTIFGLFALLAAAIAGLSVFALALQTALARTREIGVRMALGAAPTDIRRWMLGRNLWMTLGALLLAFPLSWLLERALRQWLYHVTPGSALSFAIAAAALGLLVLAAAWWPAHRSARVAPMEALRHE